MRANRILLLVATLVCLAAPLSAAQAQMAGLISSLTQQLDVTPKQAEGGAGAMFGYAKSNLSAQDFGTVSSSLPGVEALIAKAPQVAAPKSGGGSSLMGSVGSLLGTAGKGLTSADQLSQSFSSLGLAPAMIQQFAPIVMQYAEQVGGPGVAQILQGSLMLLQ